MSTKQEANFAIIQSGGKQYKVSEGTILDIEKINTEQGTSHTFENVLLFSDGSTTQLGQPCLDNVSVTGKVLNQYRDKKKIVFKFKNKTGYKKKQGHRQSLTTILVESIKAKAKKTEAKKIETKSENSKETKPSTATVKKTTKKTEDKKSTEKKASAKETTKSEG